MLKIGQNAPEFSLPNQDDVTTSLKDFKGKRIWHSSYKSRWFKNNLQAL